MRSPGPALNLRAALTQELRAAAEELEKIESKPRAIHRARVRLKRARALARVGRACAPGLSEVFNDSARSVMRMLAEARDLAALAEAARKTAKHAHKSEAAALEAIAEEIDAERAAIGGPDIDTLGSGLRDLIALAQVWPEASARQIERGASRLVRKARRARKRAQEVGNPQRRHQWRKREKDRLFAATLLEDAWPTRRRRKLGEKLGDVLGDERDALLLIEHVLNAPLCDGKTGKRALKALQRRLGKLSCRANDLGARVHADGV
jgi:hypothetical protein